MPDQASSLFDGLIKGTVETFYRFMGLTLATLLIPFVKRTRRFWPAVISAQTNFSSVSFLVIWIFFVFALENGTYTRVPGALLSKRTDYPILYIILKAFLLAIVIDLLVRICCLFISNSVRRRLYQPLMRLCVGAIFIGGCIDFLAILSGLINQNSFVYYSVQLHLLPLQLFGLPFDYIIAVHLFALPVAIMTVKLLRTRTWANKLAVMLAIILFVPFAVTNLATRVFLQTTNVMAAIIPEPQVALDETNTECKIKNDKSFTVHSYLKIRNAKAFVFSGDFFNVYTKDKKFLGTGDPSQSFVLSDSTFMPIELIMTFAKDASKPNQSPFDCRLRLNYALELPGANPVPQLGDPP